jgi:hypothetical protein
MAHPAVVKLLVNDLANFIPVFSGRGPVLIIVVSPCGQCRNFCITPQLVLVTLIFGVSCFAASNFQIDKS